MHSPILISCGTIIHICGASSSSSSKWGCDYTARTCDAGVKIVLCSLFASFVSSTYSACPRAPRRWREMRCCQSKCSAAQGFLIPVNFLLSAGKPFIFLYIYIHVRENTHTKNSLRVDLSNIAHHCMHHRMD